MSFFGCSNQFLPAIFDFVLAERSIELVDHFRTEVALIFLVYNG